MKRFLVLFCIAGLGFPVCAQTAPEELLHAAGLYAQDSVPEVASLQPASAQEIDTLLAGQLTLTDCIRIALAHSPQALSARLNVQEAHVGLNLARAEFLPTVSAGVSQNYTVATPKGASTSDHGDSNVYAQAQLAISGLTDKARAVKIQKLQVEQAELELNNQTNLISRSVKKAYYALLSANHTVDIRTKSRDLYQEQYERSAEYYKQGLRPKMDVTTAEVNLNNEKLRLIRAQNQVKTASANLANTMGITTSRQLDLADMDEPEEITIPFDEAVQTAYANRPDILSAQTNAKIGQIKLNQAKFAYWPTLSLSAGYRKYDEDFRLDNAEGKLMVALDFPIFNAFRTYNGVKQARINLERTNNANRSLFNDVFLEVQNAYISLQEAAESIPIAQLNVEKAKENLGLAQGRYNEGIGDVIELKDAEVAYTDAELSLLTARYDYASAVADLKQAMGTD